MPNTTFGIMDEVRHLLKVEKFDKIIKMIENLILQQIVYV